jgi:hypothetical protein
MGDQIPASDDRERLLDSLTETIGSTKRLAELLEASADQSARTELSMLAEKMLSLLWEEALTELRDSRRWQTLAVDRETFESQLDRLLRKIAILRRFESGVPERKAYRPTTQSSRDRDIYRLREVERWSFGKIAGKHHMTDKQAERAYSRFVLNDRKKLRSSLDILLDIHDVLVQLGRIAPLPPFTPTT